MFHLGQDDHAGLCLVLVLGGEDFLHLVIQVVFLADVRHALYHLVMVDSLERVAIDVIFLLCVRGACRGVITSTLLFWKSNCTGAAVVANAVAIMIDIKSYTIRKAVNRCPSPFRVFVCGFRQVTPAYQVRDTRVIHVAISSRMVRNGQGKRSKIYRTPVARLYFGFSRR